MLGRQTQQTRKEDAVFPVDEPNSLDLMTPPECWQLLAGHRVGRVAVMGGHGPEIYPINYAVDGHTIVFRTDPGTKLASLLRWSSVGFEIDHVDELHRVGWSVLVKGDAREVVDEDELAALRQLPLDVWTTGEAAHWVRIIPQEVTGRRLVPLGD